MDKDRVRFSPSHEGRAFSACIFHGWLCTASFAFSRLISSSYFAAVSETDGGYHKRVSFIERLLGAHWIIVVPTNKQGLLRVETKS